MQLITTVLLALAANTSFAGLPGLASLLARDNYLPHLFSLRADRQVHRYGVFVLAVLAAALLVVAGGNTQRLVPLFAIGVFVGFTLGAYLVVVVIAIQRGTVNVVICRLHFQLANWPEPGSSPDAIH